MVDQLAADRPFGKKEQQTQRQYQDCDADRKGEAIR